MSPGIRLIVNTPEKYAALTGVQVRTGREAVGLKAAEKKVEVRNLGGRGSDGGGL